MQYIGWSGRSGDIYRVVQLVRNIKDRTGRTTLYIAPGGGICNAGRPRCDGPIRLPGPTRHHFRPESTSETERPLKQSLGAQGGLSCDGGSKCHDPIRPPRPGATKMPAGKHFGDPEAPKTAPRDPGGKEGDT